jgi:histidyl-tRNA synthetase
MHGQALPGFRDFYPPELALRNRIFATWRDVARRYAFEEYDGPPLEPLELYTAKSGQEIVGQLYEFTDKGDRRVALRPEMTPSLARMVGARAQALKKPIRWFSIPQLFRYERQQRGRLREHFQLNMDIIGEAGPAADAEIIAAVIDIMRAFGLGPKDIRVRMSDRRVLTALLQQNPQFQGERIKIAFDALDKSDRQSREQVGALLRDAHFDPPAVDRLFEVASLQGLGAVVAELRTCPGGAETGENLQSVVAALEAMGLSDFVEIDLRIVRGLAYYTGIVFELFDAKQALRAICGGGRYDNLIREIAGIDLPCVGFGMGDVVLGELLKEKGKATEAPSQLDAFLIAVSSEDVAFVLKLARELRDRGIAVEYALRHAPIRKQLELAVAHGAARAVIVGPDERKAKVAVVRDLKTGRQRKVPLVKVRKGILK